jgi:hypothetical protein
MSLTVFFAIFREDDFAAGFAGAVARAVAGLAGPFPFGFPAGFSRPALAARFNSAAAALAAASFASIGARCTCAKRTWSATVW